MRSIATIGCEGASPERFEDALNAARIDLLVDVRPAGDLDGEFTQDLLERRMQASDRTYLRLQALACVGELARLTAGHRVALVGYEADARASHRARIAEQVADLANLAILHLRVTEEIGPDAAELVAA
jgi:uncharacterized protein (DUF488 family)